MFRFAVFVSLIGVATTALPQTLEQYREAANAKGCGLIASPSVQEDCRSAIKEQDEKCEGKKFECGQDLDRANKSEISNRIEVGKACLEKREKVAAIFERARSSMANESNDAYKEFAKQSAQKIADGQPGHLRQIEGVKASIFNCNQLYQ